MPYELSGAERDRLTTLLAETFEWAQLDQLVNITFNRDLRWYVAPAAYQTELFNLIRALERTNELPKLVKAAAARCPSVLELAQFAARLDGLPMGIEAHRLSQLSKFDLELLVRAFKVGLSTQASGIVAFGIVVEADPFLKYFCDRLIQELRPRKLDVRDRLTLRPQITSVETALRIISRYKTLLSWTDVMCPVRVEGTDAATAHDMAEEFWARTTQVYSGSAAHSLILLMTGAEGGAFPSAARKLPSPAFDQTDVGDWIRAVLLAQGWGEDVEAEWTELFLAECVYGDMLDLHSVYEHLRDAVDLLQLAPTSRQFLDQLKERTQVYG